MRGFVHQTQKARQQSGSRPRNPYADRDALAPDVIRPHLITNFRQKVVSHALRKAPFSAHCIPISINEFEGGFCLDMSSSGANIETPPVLCPIRGRQTLERIPENTERKARVTKECRPRELHFPIGSRFHRLFTLSASKKSESRSMSSEDNESRI
jgi:hypothetical protein